ncbi:MAG TPA: DNA-binding response regulator [Acholeplasmataceae bacterium]|nr:DNA-binding response regulator [Acholeplasmataceae bacterium]
MYQSILIIEDDKGVVKLLSIALESNQFDVSKVSLGKEGLFELTQKSYDMVLLDLGLPDIDGIEVLKEIRKERNLPVIVISARFKEEEKVEALELGADDYLTKPFGVNELVARIKAVFKRYQVNPIDEHQTTFDELTVNFKNRSVKVNDEQSHLTPIEFNILKYLIENRGRVCTHKMIQEKVWGYDSTDGYQSLRVFIGNIRRKIKDDVFKPKYILTESGIGYRFIA